MDTPYLAVDPVVLQSNIDAMARRAHDAGLALRPHAKTHKCAEIARRQIESGAVGLTVATIGEAEAFAAAGFTDLFIAYPLWLTENKGARLRAVAAQASIRLAVDSVVGADAMAAALGPTRAEVQIVVEVDSGHHRTGVAPELAGSVAAHARSTGLDVVGVFTFPGHGYGPDRRGAAARQESHALSTAAASLRSAGIDPVVRSGGSTPTIEFADPDALTEIRPGVYPFNDAQQVELGTADVDDVALVAVATVVRRDGNRVVVDAGSKVLGSDRAEWATGFGRLPDRPDARVVALSEHHATVEFPSGAVPEPGSRVRVAPNHVCIAVNLADELVATSDGSPIERWPVMARGANS